MGLFRVERGSHRQQGASHSSYSSSVVSVCVFLNAAIDDTSYCILSVLVDSGYVRHRCGICINIFSGLKGNALRADKAYVALYLALEYAILIPSENRSEIPQSA